MDRERGKERERAREREREREREKRIQNQVNVLYAEDILPMRQKKPMKKQINVQTGAGQRK